MNKKPIIKTTIKSIIALLVFSLVLEINSKNFDNYLIFVASWLFVTFIYEASKYSVIISINENGVEIKGFFKHNFINFKTIKDVFLTSGILQKRFNLYSVYLVQEKRTIPLRDLTNGVQVLNQIEVAIGKKKTEFT